MKRFDWVKDLNAEGAYAIAHYALWLKCTNACDGNNLYRAISFITPDDSSVIGEGLMRSLSFSAIFEETLRDTVEDYEY